jgi:hypothetical protein
MEKPFLVSAQLIKPIQRREKTETRRTAGLDKINHDPDRFTLVRMEYLDNVELFRAVFLDGHTGQEVKINSPYGGYETTLWVRENWYVGQGYDLTKPRDLPKPPQRILQGFEADGDRPAWAGKLRPGIHMPRWMTRILLTNKDTHPERLHDITDDGAQSEGVASRIHFAELWKDINGGSEAWYSNPWVWVIKFTLQTQKDGTQTTHTPGN